VLSQLRNVDNTALGLNWDCPDEFERQCCPLSAAWDGDYPEDILVAQVSYASCPMCEVQKGAPMGYSTLQPLDNPRD
jgi:hypothetical protein